MPDETTLDQLVVGEGGEVARVSGSGGVAVRLLEMGFVPGTRVELVKRAPLGDPLELRIRGYHLSLRRAEAALVRVRR
ncbi:MAG: ferrous iron transport protein A [Myxococcales bacterium]|nr:ferrous iron transport protein A [Myxococcales bacterium]